MSFGREVLIGIGAELGPDRREGIDMNLDRHARVMPDSASIGAPSASVPSSPATGGPTAIEAGGVGLDPNVRRGGRARAKKAAGAAEIAVLKKNRWRTQVSMRAAAAFTLSAIGELANHGSDINRMEQIGALPLRDLDLFPQVSRTGLVGDTRWKK